MAAKIYQNANNRFKHLTTLIFDMDNTLIPTRRADLKTCNKVSDPGMKRKPFRKYTGCAHIS